MKKIYLFLASVALVGAMTSCESDPETVYQEPTEFTLNLPPTAALYYDLTENSSMNLTWSQPNYGYAAAANYEVQISLEESFTKDDADYFQTVAKSTVCNVDIPDADIAVGINKMRGVSCPDDYVDLGYQPLYIRVVASLPGVATSEIISNVIKLDNVQDYCAMNEARTMYLIGSPAGWKGPDQDNISELSKWALNETGIGTNIYMGVFDIKAGDPTIDAEDPTLQYTINFRFFTELKGWGGKCIGYGGDADDPHINDNFIVPMDGDEATVRGEVGKSDNFAIDWAGGPMTITVDMTDADNIQVTFSAGADDDAYPCIYVVGDFAGWKEPSEDNADYYKAYRLIDKNFAGIYEGTFEVAAGKAMFRFYLELTGWDGGASIGVQAADSPIDKDFVGDEFTGPYVAPGKGAWNFPSWEGGKMRMTVNTNDQTVVFVKL